MAIHSGFFNSYSGDRLYNADDINTFFSGFVEDGVFDTIGTVFAQSVTGTDLTVTIGSGKAWFNNHYLFNDADYLVSLNPLPAGSQSRYDAIVIDIDTSTEVRACQILVVEGTPASTPSHPEMIHNAWHNQYAICYVLRQSSSTVITQADITNAIGTVETPLIVRLIEHMVPNSRTINGKPLSSDIVLDAPDVGAVAGNYTFIGTLTQNSGVSFNVTGHKGLVLDHEAQTGTNHYHRLFTIPSAFLTAANKTFTVGQSYFAGGDGRQGVAMNISTTAASWVSAHSNGLTLTGVHFYYYD